MIALYGSMGEGKDTVANKLLQYFPTYKNVKFADKLKEIVCLLAGCKREDLESQEFKDKELSYPFVHPITKEKITYREVLQYVGTPLFRDQFDKDIWVNVLFANHDNNIIISDLRMLNEYHAIKERGGIVIRVERRQSFNDWIKDKVFEGHIKGDINIESKQKISKHYFMDLMVQEYKEHLSDKFESKYLHTSETELYREEMKGNISFDYVLANHTDIEGLYHRTDQMVKDLWGYKLK